MRLPGIFSIAAPTRSIQARPIQTRPMPKISGQTLNSSAAMKLHGSTTTRFTPCCAVRSKPARGPSGLSRCAAAIRRRWPGLKRNTAASWPSSVCCSLPFQGNGIFSEDLRRAARYASSATWPSSSTWTRRMCGFTRSIFELDERPQADPRRRRAARLLFRHRPALGQSALSLGCAGCDGPTSRVSPGGSTACAAPCELYDIVRLDHFRGFEAYWAIPAEEETAVNGEWVKAPGLELFRALEAALGPLPLVAEDLGLITPEVDALRLELGLPGMKVLQFGFSDKGAHIAPAAPVHARHRGLHRHARQRHHAGLVEDGRARRNAQPSRRSWVRSTSAPRGR